MKNPPLVFMWVAWYEDETTFPQFDFETGKENPFKAVKQNKMIKFGWYPIPQDFAEKIGDVVESRTWLPYYEVNLGKEDKLIAKREGKIDYTINNGLQLLSHTKKYVLGIEGKFVMHIDEFGNVEVK
jgi:hypothetical protein